MYGSTMGTLNVYVGQKKVFTKSGDQGNQWKKATVDINEPGATEVRTTIGNLHVHFKRCPISNVPYFLN